MNAIADAGANIDMPATPERVWRALQHPPSFRRNPKG
jgi:hypothetical protein